MPKVRKLFVDVEQLIRFMLLSVKDRQAIVEKRSLLSVKTLKFGPKVATGSTSLNLVIFTCSVPAILQLFLLFF